MAAGSAAAGTGVVSVHHFRVPDALPDAGADAAATTTLEVPAEAGLPVAELAVTELERAGKLTTPCDTITPDGLVPPEPPVRTASDPNPVPPVELDVLDELELDPDPLVPSPPLPLAALLPFVGIVMSAGSRPATASAINIAAGAGGAPREMPSYVPVPCTLLSCETSASGKASPFMLLVSGSNSTGSVARPSQSMPSVVAGIVGSSSPSSAASGLAAGPSEPA